MTTEEMAVFIGERLFGLTTVKGPVSGTPYSFWNINEGTSFDEGAIHGCRSFPLWIQRPIGVHSVKLAMIDRGYGWEGGYDTEFYSYTYYRINHYDDSITICESTESAALLTSVYAALKAEED